MDIQEVKDRKVKLQQDIVVLCSTFMNDTGTTLKAINLDQKFEDIGHNNSVHVSLNVKIDVEI